MDFNTIKRNFDRGLWNAQQVKFAVRAGVITSEQYKEITKSEYEEG